MTYDEVIAADSPSAWWKLADVAGSGTAADSSGNGWDGTASDITFGNPSQAVPGNTSASFNGSTSAITTLFMPSGAAISLEAWLNFDGNDPATQPLTHNPRIMANDHTDADNNGFQFLGNDSAGYTEGPSIYMGFGGGDGGRAGDNVALPINGWSYLVTTFDGADIRLYVNGAQTSIAAVTGMLAAGSTGVGLGFNPAYDGDWLTGLLSECAIYDYALTPAQIGAHYAAARAPRTVSSMLLFTGGL